MRRTSLIVIVSVLAVLVVVAVAVRLANFGSPNSPQGPTGTLTGALQVEGGPPGAGPRPLAGQVTLHGPDGHLTDISVGANGRFSLPVAVGTYTVSGQSPQYQAGNATCHAGKSVIVTNGLTTHVQVDCGEK